MRGCNCQRHGRTAINFACPHAVSGLGSDKMPKKMTRLMCELGDFLGFSEMPVQIVTKYCLECAEKYRLPVEDSQCLAEDFETIVPDEISIPVCSQCYAEAMSRSAT